MNTEAAAIVGVVGGIAGMIGLVLGLVCVSIVAGFVRSTHTVQYVPHENPILDEEVKEDNEEALLNKVGRKSRKKEWPTNLENLDQPIEQILQSDILI